MTWNSTIIEVRGFLLLKAAMTSAHAAARESSCGASSVVSPDKGPTDGRGGPPAAAAGAVTRARGRSKRSYAEANADAPARQADAGGADADADADASPSQANADASPSQANADASPSQANADAFTRQPFRECWQFPSKTAQVAALGELEWSKRALCDVVFGGRTERVNQLRAEDIRQWVQLKAPELLSELLRLFPDVPAFQKRTAQQMCSPEFESSGFLEARLHARGAFSLEVAQDKGNSAAHRELSSDRLLVLKLEESRKENPPHFYKQVLTHGFVLGLRRFRYFAHKSSDGKDAPARAFTAAMELESAYDKRHPPQHPAFTSGRPLLHYFGNFAGCPSMRKMAARPQLLFSSTLPAARKPAFEDIQVLPDISCQDGSLATDGTGLILHHLVPPMYIVQGRDCSPPDLEARPSVLQVRDFCNGMEVKGTLLAVTRMPEGVREGVQILLRDRPPARDTTLSRVPVSLLCHGGVPQEYFLGCTRKALEKVKLATQDRKAAMKLMKGGAINETTELGMRMLMCGVDLYDPHLQDLLRLKQKEKLKKLAGSSVAAGRSHYLLGVADFTGTLKEGEVYVVTDDGPLAGDCLVHRYPGVQLANIRKLRAVDCPELRSYLPPDARHFIAFSTKGRRSEPDKMAGGDLDGDDYLIVDAFQPSDDFPAEEKSQVAPDPKALDQASPASLSWEEQRVAMIDIFLESCYSPGVTGRASNLHAAYLDEWGPRDARTVEMGSLYEKALDAEKAGGMHPLGDNVKGELRHEMREYNGRLARILNSVKSARDREEELKENERRYRQVVCHGWIPAKDEPTPAEELLAKAAFIYVHGYEEAQKKLVFSGKLYRQQQQEQQPQKRQQQEEEEHTGEEHAHTGEGGRSVKELYRCARVRGMQCVWGVFGDLLCTIKASLDNPMLISGSAWQSIDGRVIRPHHDLSNDCIMDAQEVVIEDLVEVGTGNSFNLPITID
eukprot:jgi/Mesen1/8509/ME000480S07862